MPSQSSAWDYKLSLSRPEFDPWLGNKDPTKNYIFLIN